MTIYVAPECHRQGFGRFLLARLVANAEARGFHQMVAVIGDSANAASIGLHAALGFHHVGTLQSIGFKHGRWLDVIIMQRPLGDGDSTAP
jgi:phosphinothricin acetyltransferase